MTSNMHSAPQPGYTKSPLTKKRPSKLKIIVGSILAVSLCFALSGIGYLAWEQYKLDKEAEYLLSLPEPEILTVSDLEGDTLPDNPIDFESLQAENEDIYAWVYIPNTNINLPVLQHPTNDEYYLDYNMYKEASSQGAIFTQAANSTDFSDSVTVLYGHNLINETMFTTLHYFEDSDFFNENEYIYIYTPGHVLTYQIISAYTYDDRHILNSFDFTDFEVLEEYYDYVCDPTSLTVNTRSGIELTTDDKIIQLSTCVSGTIYSESRYVVTGVLIDDQQTN